MWWRRSCRIASMKPAGWSIRRHGWATTSRAGWGLHRGLWDPVITKKTFKALQGTVAPGDGENPSRTLLFFFICYFYLFFFRKLRYTLSYVEHARMLVFGESFFTMPNPNNITPFLNQPWIPKGKQGRSENLSKEH